MKYIKPINEIWGPVLKRDLLGETREEDKFRSRDELREYLVSEIEKQGDYVVIQNLDVSNIKDLNYLFDGIGYDVKALNLSGWKTSGVKNMADMFYSHYSLKSLDLSGWDTSDVEDMGEMFYYCSSLESIDLSGWDTSSVKYMSRMFFCCDSLKSLDISGWDTSNVEGMNKMFSHCKDLKSLDLSGWNTSNVIHMDDMFVYSSLPYEVIDNKIVRK